MLDPQYDSWDSPNVFHDQESFMQFFESNASMDAFIDESGDMVGRYDTVMQRTATKGRHYGHKCYYITQRGTQLALTVRDQCDHLFLFAVGPKDAAVHAEEWSRQELLDAPNLSQGEFFYVTRFGKVQRRRVF